MAGTAATTTDAVMTAAGAAVPTPAAATTRQICISAVTSNAGNRRLGRAHSRTSLGAAVTGSGIRSTSDCPVPTGDAAACAARTITWTSSSGAPPMAVDEPRCTTATAAAGCHDLRTVTLDRAATAATATVLCLAAAAIAASNAI